MQATILFALLVVIPLWARILTNNQNAIDYPAVPHFKGIQTDFFAAQDFVGNGVGMIAINFYWPEWQPLKKQAPCGKEQILFDKFCFTVPAKTDMYVQQFPASVKIVAIVVASPGWAIVQRQHCPNWAPGANVWCAPDNFEDYYRFVQFLAWYYGAAKRVAIYDFVIWNEVQCDAWFSLGGYPNRGNQVQRAQEAARMYWGAFRALKQYNDAARAYVSLEHHFGDDDALCFSGYKVLEQIIAQSNGEQYHVAIHPYSKQVGGPNFSDADRPYITFGTLNILLGWLQQRHSTGLVPTVMITEVGITSQGLGSSLEVQSQALCSAYEQALATPGITGFIYHRFQDHPAETAGGLFIGLRDTSNNFKPAWATWALMDRTTLKCGFQYGSNMLRVQRYRNPAGEYWVTPRNPNAYGFYVEDMYWILSRVPQATFTKPLYDCQVPGTQDHFISPSATCEGQQNTGMIGYVQPQSGNKPLYRCRSTNGHNHFVSVHSNCEGWITEMLLGYTSN